MNIKSFIFDILENLSRRLNYDNKRQCKESNIRSEIFYSFSKQFYLLLLELFINHSMNTGSRYTKIKKYT